MKGIARTVPTQSIVRVATPEEDKMLGTDLVVIKCGDASVACRIRRLRYRRWPFVNEFTIRSHRPGDIPTEKHKFFGKGLGDWMLYGFEAPLTKEEQDAGKLIINPWVVIDLHKLREVRKDQEKWNAAFRGEKPLPNGCKFWAINIDDLPPECVLQRSRLNAHLTPEAAATETQSTAAERKRIAAEKKDRQTKNFLDSFHTIPKKKKA